MPSPLGRLIKGLIMDFYEVLDQVLVLLQRHGRVSYRALKRQFDLDDDCIDELKDELLHSRHAIADEDGQRQVCTDGTVAPEPALRHAAEAEARFQAILPVLTGLLQCEGRLTYRLLRQTFGFDDALLEGLRKELRFRRLAIDEDGEGLVWTGAAPSTETPRRLSMRSETITPAAPRIMEPDVSPDEFATAPEPARTAPDAERRQLTVMFCDLADSTILAQQLDPEDLREVIRAYQATAAAVVQQYAGTIAQYLGDGLLVYFGWPLAHEDDALRGVHAGLGLIEAITTTLNPRLQREKGVRVAVRIGLHTGPVVGGEMGGGERHEQLATGDTVNIASRLEGLATPKTVVISSTTERLVQPAFALEPLGRHALKGIAEPMALFRVLGPMETHEDETRASGLPFLVGRDEEIGLLLRRWEQSKADMGQVVLLSGEAGIGKSALVEVLRAHLRAEGLPRITVHCSPYHQNSALYPVMTHLEHLLHFEREDPPAAKLDKLVQGLQTSSLPLAEMVPLVATLLSVPLQGRYAMPTLTSQQHKQQTLDALVAWLVDEAERQPLLLVWENLHWADPSTLELLTLVLEQTPTVPLCSVLTFRPEFQPPWPMRSHMTPLTLNRLERPQVEAVITHLVGGRSCQRRWCSTW
jgi:class 3 adenylate cyclase